MNQTRYLKTSMNATIGHIQSFLEKRHDIEKLFKANINSKLRVEASNRGEHSEKLGISSHCDSPTQSDSGIEVNRAKTSLSFTIYIAGGLAQFIQLADSLSLKQIQDEYWKIDRPLELFYSNKKTR